MVLEKLNTYKYGKVLLLVAGIFCSLCLEAQTPKLIKAPNDPVGVPLGIHPGRVAWSHAPGTSIWLGPGVGKWYEAHWNNGTDKSYTKIDLVYKKK